MRFMNATPAHRPPMSLTARAVSTLVIPLLAPGTRRRALTDITLALVKSILIVRLDGIGDMVLTSPFLRELRRNAPGALITLIVKPETRNLVEFCPYVNEVLVFDWRDFGPLSELWRLAGTAVFARKHLRVRFDLAVLPRWGADFYQETFLAYFSGAPCRVAYSEFSNEPKARLNRGYDRLLTRPLEGAGPKHQVEWNLDFLLSLGGNIVDKRLELWLTEDDRCFARQALAARAVREGEVLIAFAPGAGAKKRCWPVERWIELGRRLHCEFGPRIVLLGGKAEGDFGARIERELSGIAINLMGQLTLRQTGAILENCSLTVSNDSGPMHLAAAAGSGVVEISCHPRGGDPDHANSPVHFHPWGVPRDVLQPEPAAPSCSGSCTFCVPHCILGIEVATVQQAVRKLLARICAGNLERGTAAHAD